MNKKARRGKAGRWFHSLWRKSQNSEESQNTEYHCTHLWKSKCLQLARQKTHFWSVTFARQLFYYSIFYLRDISVLQSIQKPHFYLRITTLSYLVVAVHGSSDLPAALRTCCCGDAVAKGEGLVAMVAGRVLEWSLRGGVELQGTLGKKSWS